MNAPSFPDHFSSVSRQYAQFRPSYPPELFAWLAGQCTSHATALDCGTGSGQAALALAEHFAQVWAADASAEQIAMAKPHPRVQYLVSPSELLPVPDASLDLITVAQALHWFRLPDFYAEAERCLKPGGLLAAWCYNICSLEPEAQSRFMAYNLDYLEPYWPPERQLVMSNYADLPFPYPKMPIPAFAMTENWTVAQFCGYIGTWSATRLAIQAHGRPVIAELLELLSPVWPGQQKVEWPLHVLLGRRQ